MTEPLRAATPPRVIVEMGSGTGAVTRAIAAAMTPTDRLDCYEINPRFAEYLQRTIAERPEYAHVAQQIRVHCAAGQAASAEVPADFVICSVPLNNLPGKVAAQIMDHSLAILAAGGCFTYFEYPLLPRMLRLFSRADERRRIDSVRGEKRARGTNAATRLVMRNLPPARAVHLTRPGC